MNRDAVTRVTCAVLIVAVSSAMLAVAQPATRQGQQREDYTAYLPPGEGKALVAKQCTGCHDLRGTLQLRAAAAQWEALVLDMGARGAPIMLEDIDPLVRYLSTVFGPKAPPFINASSATKADLTRLPGVTPEAADRLIAVRGAGTLTSTEQIRTALGLDVPAFEKIKYYLYVAPAGRAGNR
jgi:hypothetical protein